ncbi:putative NAD(P)H-quinone oxidoreductase subunit M [Helianthus annuus]|nr:putative NAD(P)H-quinone oxidoreductase subunit M [Helianthus annuus]
MASSLSSMASIMGMKPMNKQEILISKRRTNNGFSVFAQQVQEETTSLQPEEEKEAKPVKGVTQPRPVEPQVNVESKNMGRAYGGQWLSSTTRHVRIFAAYIDPETCAFDQTQMDKLTLILDPTDEFVWTTETCNMVYSYFQELVDHYEVISVTG